MAALMQDHPGWNRQPDGLAVRAMRADGCTWLLTWRTDEPSVAAGPITLPGRAAPIVDRFVGVQPPGPLAPLGRALASLGGVLRVRNSDLWDAIGTAVIRQVIRADQARQMYRRFCQAHGEKVATTAGGLHLFPPPETVVALPAEAFTELGMAFKRAPLVAAAEAVIEHGEKWAQLDPADLVQTLQSVPRIGPWTAGAAVADFSGDFALYPYADLAVRTWARRAAPHVDWPQDEVSFGAYWRYGAGEHLSALTVLVLAWGGSHVRAP